MPPIPVPSLRKSALLSRDAPIFLERHGSNESRMHVDHEPSCSAQGTSTEPYLQALSAEEMQDQLERFTHIMQQKFLAGEDTEHLDYSKVDNDEGLDDHWLMEAKL